MLSIEQKFHFNFMMYMFYNNLRNVTFIKDSVQCTMSSNKSELKLETI